MMRPEEILARHLAELRHSGRKRLAEREALEIFTGYDAT
jgi:hypothetical protein